jgi:xanthine dehydrogenase accessory factor
VEARVISDALNALDDGRGPRNMHYKLDELGMSCGGEMSVYIEPMEPPRRIIIYGGGHVAAATARVLKTVGCILTVVDDRDEWANRERFPDADEIVNRPFPEQLTMSPPGPKDHVIIVTRGHDHDQVVLEGAIKKKPVYIGMIGSRKKSAQALERLRAKKVPDELIRAVRTPIGLDIGAVTPEEIAVSIVAELVLFWRRGGAISNARARAMSRGEGKPPPRPGTGDPQKEDDDVVFEESED